MQSIKKANNKKVVQISQEMLYGVSLWLTQNGKLPSLVQKGLIQAGSESPICTVIKKLIPYFWVLPGRMERRGELYHLE